MSLGKGNRTGYTQAQRRWAEAESEKAAIQSAVRGETTRIAELAVKLAFEAVEENAVTRKDLKRIAGMIQNDKPELAAGLLRQVEAMDRVLEGRA